MANAQGRNVPTATDVLEQGSGTETPSVAYWGHIGTKGDLSYAGSLYILPVEGIPDHRWQEAQRDGFVPIAQKDAHHFIDGTWREVADKYLKARSVGDESTGPPNTAMEDDTRLPGKKERRNVFQKAGAN
jgi:hypothetical protein